MLGWLRTNQRRADVSPHLSPIRGLDDIWAYLVSESGNTEIARRQIASLTHRFFLLSNHPRLGRARDTDLGPGRRSYPVDRYVVVYRIEDADVLILRVAHGSRDIEALFKH